MSDESLDTTTSTSVSLIYTEKPVLNFADFVSRLESALREVDYEHMSLKWDHDDLVIFDLDGSRVIFGYWEATPGTNPPCKSILVLSVGPGPDWTAPAVLAGHRQALCRSVTARIAALHPADAIYWKDFKGIFRPEDFDDLIDEVMQSHSAVITAAAEQGTPEERERILERRRYLDDAPGPDLVQRLSAELEEKISQAPAAAFAQVEEATKPKRSAAAKAAATAERPAAPMPANSVPDVPHPMVVEMHRIRDALYPKEGEEEEGEQQKLPVARRLAVYTVNTTLLIVAMPAGAALLTYNILKGEDERVTAQALALTGAVIGISQLLTGHTAVLSGLVRLVGI